MKVRDFKKYAVGPVGVYDCTMSLAYFGNVEGIPLEMLDCRIDCIHLGVHSSCSEDDDNLIPFPFFIVRLEG